MQNIILVGMPGSGKSTLGRTLAKTLSYRFIDTDDVIMETYHSSLMQLIARHGTEGFIQLEGKVIQSIHTSHAVISTGGSAVYQKEAMQYLQSIGMVAYLRHALSDLTYRVENMVSRGVVCRTGCETLSDLYRERCPLYEVYADVTVELTDCSVRECSERLRKAVQKKLSEM